MSTTDLTDSALSVPASPGSDGAGPAAGRPVARARRIRLPGTKTVVIGLWVLATLALVVYPLALLFRLSLRSPAGAYGGVNYRDFFADDKLLEAMWNSLWTAFASTVGCVLLGVPLAYLVARTDLPFRRLIRATSVLTFAIPNFIVVLGWMLLLGPRSGMLNTPLQSLFGLDDGPFDIFTPWGVVFAIVVHVYPLVFLPTAAALDNMEPPLEQAAASLGAGRWVVLRRVTLPLILPGILAGSLLVFITSFVAFGPVLLLGGPVGFENISTAMLRLLRFPSRIEMAAVLGVPTLFVLTALLIIQRRYLGGREFSIVSGKPGQQGLVRLGRWRWPAAMVSLGVFALTIILPFGVLLLTSMRKTMGFPVGLDNFTLLDNYTKMFEQPKVTEAFKNSLVLAALSSVAGILIALLGAWIVERLRVRWSWIVAPAMLAPLAFPGSILGISLVIAYGPKPLALAGTTTILLIAYTISTLPLAFTYQRAGLKQIDRSLEEAARSLGASWTQTMRKVTLPLLKGPVAVVAVLTFVIHLRDLDASIFLFNGSNPVIAVVLLNLAEASLFQQIGALSIVLLLVNLVVIGLAMLGYRMSKRRRRGATV